MKFSATYDVIPFKIEINVALREQICQKIGSERTDVAVGIEEKLHIPLTIFYVKCQLRTKTTYEFRFV